MLHLLLFYPSTWYICDFFLFHIEIEGKDGWIIWGGGGGGQRVCWPRPSQIIGGPLPTSMSGTYYMLFKRSLASLFFFHFLAKLCEKVGFQ